MAYRNRGRLRQFKSKFEKKIHGELADVGVESNYEAERIKYTLQKEYRPDFPVKKKDGSYMYLEAKGIFDSEDRRKHVAVKEQHPEKDVRFIFYKDYKTSKGAKQTYSKWCDRHGFQYCIQTIPDEWLAELANYKPKKKKKETK